MKLIFTLLLLFSASAIADSKAVVSPDCDRVIAYQSYTVCYSLKYKSPLFTSYTVTPAMIASPVIKGRPSFHVEKRIDKKHRASNNDYANTGYDKGHLAPNSALNYSGEAQYDTFTLANAAPQVSNFNRILWGKIESRIRVIAERKIVGIVTGLCFDDAPETLGRNHIAIPNAYFKLVQYDDSLTLYYAKNIEHKDKDISHYVMSLDKFNSLCGSVEII